MKTKLVVGITLAVLLLVIGQYFLLPARYRELVGVDVFGWLVMLSVGIGLALSIWLLNYVVQKLIDGKPFDLFGLSSAAPTGSKIGSYLAAIVSLPFAFFAGFTAGGIMGGGTGEMIAGDWGVPIGIGLGVFIIMTIVSVAAALIGFILGGFTEKLVRTVRT